MDAQNTTPVIVGVGDIVNRSTRVEDAIEPLELMLQAIQKAFEDAIHPGSDCSKLTSAIDSVEIVSTWTWPYPDLPGLLSQRLSIHPQHKHYSPLGGNQPAKLLDDAARRISLGQAKVAILTGGEALASLSACAQSKKLPPPGWTKIDGSIESVFSPSTRALPDNLGGTHSIGAPIQVYPLYENALRAHRKQSFEDNHDESAKLYADFAQVSSQNEYAWSYGKPAASADSIRSVNRRNRMICYPYPLLMNAFNTVNLAAAVVLTSTSFARELGIPESKWTYPIGGAGTSDAGDFWKRPNFSSSPAISASLDAGIASSGVSVENIDMYDFYSCFPIVPKLACHHLKLPLVNPPKQITLLGGLTSFGGAGNNYSMHAITEMTRQLRAARSKSQSLKNGLILANGGVLTYQHVVVLSTSPRNHSDNKSYPSASPLPDLLPTSEPPVDIFVEGEAEIETYTIDYDRANTPSLGHVVGRLKRNGHRFLANHGDERTLNALASEAEEIVGRAVYVRRAKDGKRNVVFVDSLVARL